MAPKKQANPKPKPGQLLLKPTYDPRFFEDAIGRTLLSDPKVAIMELIANAWDAFATKVVIQLPNTETGQCFSIEDNGCGMTHEEFEARWMKLSYNRIDHQGIYAEKPPKCKTLPDRKAFGRNGKGRHASFCFSKGEFFVETHKAGKRHLFRVFRPANQDRPFESEKKEESTSKKTGTKLYAEAPVDVSIYPHELRAEIGMRFLSDPTFEVIVDGQKVEFEHVPDHCKTTADIDVPGVGTIKLLTIDTQESDRTTRLHGIAWQVRGRLVGEATWKNFGDEKFIDGRRTAAKRYSFIVQADCLDREGWILADWTGFNMKEDGIKKSFELVNEGIRKFLLEQSAEEREETFNNIKAKNAPLLKRMGPRNAEVWNTFVNKVQEECPSLSEKEVESVAGILAKLEASKSQYALLQKLHSCSPDDLDALNQIMESWTVETAKIVLDELENRLGLIAELESKMLDDKTDELHDLQPIFDRGLWIFGPEFESIEFTSNRTMATVVTKLLKLDKIDGSNKRPDFVVLPDGSVSFHSRPAYDDKHEEDGVEILVIVELKKPSVLLGSKERNQCYDYVKELRTKGAIKQSTLVHCFLLGKLIEPGEEGHTTHGSDTQGKCIIRPMIFQTVIGRAKARTLGLYNKVKNAPFLNQSEIDEYLQPQKVNIDIQMTMFEESTLDVTPPVS
jgi:hypothetical protein